MKIDEVISPELLINSNKYTFFVKEIPEPLTARDHNGLPKNNFRSFLPADSVYIQAIAGKTYRGWGKLFNELNDLPNNVLNIINSIERINQNVSSNGYGKFEISRVIVLYDPLRVLIDLSNKRYKMGFSYITNNNIDGLDNIHTIDGVYTTSAMHDIIYVT